MESDLGKKSNICVSVVVPALNSAQYLRECIESILAQTLQQIEILCVDAGSTDGTLEMLEEYAAHDSRIRIIPSSKRSYGHQVNLGIQEAWGDYIGIVETDDYISPAMYQSLYSCAVDNGCPDFVRSGFTMFASDAAQKYFWAGYRAHSEEDYDRVIYLEKEREKGVSEMCHIWTAIYRRQLFLDKGIRLHESAGASYQDMSFSLLVGLLADTAVFVKDCWYYYRMDNEGSSSKSAAKWRCVIDEYAYAIEEFTRRGKFGGEIERLIRKNHLESYYWNMARLPEKERRLFLAAIQPEMAAYRKDGKHYGVLSEWDKECVQVLSDDAALEKHLYDKRRNDTDKVRPIVALIQNKERVVLAGVGRMSETLFSVQDALQLDFIEAAADNDAARQGKPWHQYTVLSMEEAAAQYSGLRFVVANQYASEICQQLMELGIPREHILEVQRWTVTVNELVGLLLGKTIHN